MSKFLSQKWEKRLLVLATVVLVASISLIAIISLSIGPIYIIKVNNESWNVTGTKAVQEVSYSGVYFTVIGERTFYYPGLAYDKYLEINLTVVSGALDYTIEAGGETLYQVTNAAEVIVTLPIENNQVSITESPYLTNVTLQGYIKAYCWIPIESVPSYYFRSIFSGG